MNFTIDGYITTLPDVSLGNPIQPIQILPVCVCFIRKTLEGIKPKIYLWPILKKSLQESLVGGTLSN